MPSLVRFGSGQNIVTSGGSEPGDKTEGDLYYDTTNDVLKASDGTNFNNVGKTSFSSASVITHSETIGDYTTPSDGTGSSGSSQATFSDAFDGTDDWGDQGSKVVVNTTNDVIDFDFARDGSEHATAYDLGDGNVSDTKWLLRFKFTVDNLTNPTSSNNTGWIGIYDSDETAGGQDSQTGIGLQVQRTNAGGSTYKTHDVESAIPSGDGGEDTFTEALAVHTRYVEIKRTSATEYVISLYSDSGYTTLIESETGTTSASNSGLRYIKIFNQGAIASVGGTFDGTIDDVAFYNNTNDVVSSAVFDDATGTKWESDSEANPNVYVDCGGSAINLTALAVYLHANTTETEIKIQSSSNASDWTDERTITVSDLTTGAWNFIRFNIVNARYLRVYGNSGSSLVLAISEIKYLTKTDSEILADLGILEISTSDTSLGLDGV